MFLNKKQLAERLDVHENTIYNWTRTGQIRCYRTGPRLVRYKWEEVEQDLNLR